MTYSKRFPKDTPASVHPQWIEISLSDDEEREVKKQARSKHASQLAQCLVDAKKVAKLSEVHADPSEIVNLARSLFDKQASHTVFYKERRAKEKFDSLHQN